MVHACTCVWEYAYIGTWLWRPEVNAEHLLHALLLTFGVFAARLCNLPNLPYVAVLGMGTTALKGFSMAVGDLNSGPPPCLACTMLTEPSPQPFLGCIWGHSENSMEAFLRLKLPAYTLNIMCFKFPDQPGKRSPLCWQSAELSTEKWT